MLRAYAEEHGDEARGLAELEARLAKRRKKGVRELKRGLRGHRAVVRAIERLARDGVVVRPSKNPAKAGPVLVHHFTRETLWKQYDAVLAYDTRRRPDPATLHAFRTACRRLRYALELFSDVLPDARPVVDELHGLQTEIGDMHDAHLAAELLGRWFRAGKLRATPELRRFVRDRRHVRDAARGRLGERFETVLGPRFREGLTRALEHEAT
jgi:CHAD domain-containing protein